MARSTFAMATVRGRVDETGFAAFIDVEIAAPHVAVKASGRFVGTDEVVEPREERLEAALHARRGSPRPARELELREQALVPVKLGPARVRGVGLRQATNEVVEMETETGRAMAVETREAASEAFVEAPHARRGGEVLERQERMRRARVGHREDPRDAQRGRFAEPRQAPRLGGEHRRIGAVVRLHEDGVAVRQRHAISVVDVSAGYRFGAANRSAERAFDGGGEPLVHRPSSCSRRMCSRSGPHAAMHRSMTSSKPSLE